MNEQLKQWLKEQVSKLEKDYTDELCNAQKHAYEEVLEKIQELEENGNN